MITEAEARVKWCPFARAAEENGSVGYYTSVNRMVRSGGKPDGDCLCLASACMAWRAGETPEFKRKADDAFRKYGTRLVADTGYCGLAGEASR